MRKLLTMLVLAVFLVPGLGLAQNTSGNITPEDVADQPRAVEAVDQAEELEEEDDAGITPDSFLYGLDVAFDRISLLLTFDRAAKARKGLEIARERLAEAREMALQRKMDAMERAEAEHGRSLARVRAIMDKVDENETAEAEVTIELEKGLEAHQARVAQMIEAIRLRVQANLTVEQSDRVSVILANFTARTTEVMVKVAAKRADVAVKLRERLNLTEVEVEERLARIEANIRTRIQSSIQNKVERIEVREEIMDRVQERLEEENETDENESEEGMEGFGQRLRTRAG